VCVKWSLSFRLSACDCALLTVHVLTSNKLIAACALLYTSAGSLNLKPAREYRHVTGDKRHEEERAAFEKRISLLEKGYVSKLTLSSFNIGRTLGEGAFGRVVFAQVKPTVEWVDNEKFVAIKCMGKQQVR
jgi:hypothetical protein